MERIVVASTPRWTLRTRRSDFRLLMLGNARPAEITVNVNTNEIYIGNAAGALTKVLQVTGANTFLGNVRVVNDTTGLQPLYIDPTTGEVVRYQP